MADDQDNLNRNAIQINDCLKKCVQDLATAAEALKKCTTPTTSGFTAQSKETTPGTTRSPLEEHRKLFGFKPSSTSTSTSSVYRPQAKRHKPSNKMLMIPVRNTWTHRFFLLADKTVREVPTTRDKVAHGLAGLGERDIVFQKDGNSQHVNQKLIEAYPVLENSRGFEVMRTMAGSCKILEIIGVPPGGYTVQFLKCCLLQAKGYIRPIQQTLSLEPLSLSNKDVNGFFTDPFSLSRGVRQRCHLSAPLYVLVAESLACHIRADLSLPGLSLPSQAETLLISQYHNKPEPS